MDERERVVCINVQEMHYCAFCPWGLGYSTLVKVADSGDFT